VNKPLRIRRDEPSVAIETRLLQRNRATRYVRYSFLNRCTSVSKILFEKAYNRRVTLRASEQNLCVRLFLVSYYLQCFTCTSSYASLLALDEYYLKFTYLLLYLDADSTPLAIQSVVHTVGGLAALDIHNSVIKCSTKVRCHRCSYRRCIGLPRRAVNICNALITEPI